MHVSVTNVELVVHRHYVPIRLGTINNTNPINFDMLCYLTAHYQVLLTKNKAGPKQAQQG